MPRGTRARRRLRRYANLVGWILFALLAIWTLTLLGRIPPDYLPLALEWGVALIGALIMSIILGRVLVFLTGDLLERRVRLWRVSVPLFPLAVLALKWWLFGL